MQDTAANLRKIPQTIFQRFFRTETVGGLVLLAFGLAALVIANSPLAKVYDHLWEIPVTFGIVDHQLSLSLHEWINDGLMAVFFLLVGLEIKRELLAGELSSVRQAALPIACAVGRRAVDCEAGWVTPQCSSSSSSLSSWLWRVCCCAQSTAVRVAPSSCSGRVRECSWVRE